MANAKSLSELNLEFNQFSGKLPDAIGTLFKLRRCELNDNEFEGTLLVVYLCYRFVSNVVRTLLPQAKYQLLSLISPC
jgi:hypothetical protein